MISVPLATSTTLAIPMNSPCSTTPGMSLSLLARPSAPGRKLSAMTCGSKPHRERVSNRQPPLDHLPVLQVLRIKRRAVLCERSGGDLRVVDTEPVLLRDLQCRFMRIQRD